jgi:hypothetical protein
MESRALERTVLPQKLILERISFILFHGHTTTPRQHTRPTELRRETLSRIKTLQKTKYSCWAHPYSPYFPSTRLVWRSIPKRILRVLSVRQVSEMEMGLNQSINHQPIINQSINHEIRILLIVISSRFLPPHRPHSLITCPCHTYISSHFICSVHTSL